MCKKNAKRCGLCYHFGPCRCACVLKPLLDDDNIIDAERESNSFKHFVCTCCEKHDPDELSIPCGDSNESEKDPLVTHESEINLLTL